MPYYKERIGEYLQGKGLITPEQLQDALNEQKRSGEKIGIVLVKKGYIAEVTMVKSLSEQLGIPFIDIENYSIDPGSAGLFTFEMAQKYEAIPVNKVLDALVVAMVDPLNVVVIDEMKKKCGLTVRPAFAIPSGIRKMIEKYYAGKEQAAGKVSYHEPIPEKKGEDDLETLVKKASDAPVISLIDALLAQAVQIGASDIHIEPEEDKVYVRLRVDGILQEAESISKELGPSVISRIKIISNMDISEKRLPQDGRTQMTISGKEIDFRISTFPTYHGENMAVRLLDKSQGLFKLEDLGFRKDVFDKFKEQIVKPYGIVLVTGPTGSGKTTTLYAVLNLINDLKKNIITLEDPIEYLIPRVRQSQVNIKAGLTFAAGLRAILRHDPDIVMIGEIRDAETAEIAVHSALTGHLVFSTLHTNDAASAASRLIDMGIEPFLVVSSLNGILAQRLVRSLCPKCKKAYTPSESELAILELDPYRKDITLYKEEGCSWCRLTGYKGRLGIYELLVLNETIKELILKKAPAHQIRECAVKSGMCTLRKDAVDKLLKGVTSFSEVLRVTEEV